VTIDFAINPMTEEFRTNCASHYLQLLAEQPVVKTELDQWLVCKHADVYRVLTDHDNFQRPSNWSNQRKPAGPLREFGENNMVGILEISQSKKSYIVTGGSKIEDYLVKKITDNIVVLEKSGEEFKLEYKRE